MNLAILYDIDVHVCTIRMGKDVPPHISKTNIFAFLGMINMHVYSLNAMIQAVSVYTKEFQCNQQ